MRQPREAIEASREVTEVGREVTEVSREATEVSREVTGVSQNARSRTAQSPLRETHALCVRRGGEGIGVIRRWAVAAPVTQYEPGRPA